MNYVIPEGYILKQQLPRVPKINQFYIRVNKKGQQIKTRKSDNPKDEDFNIWVFEACKNTEIDDELCESDILGFKRYILKKKSEKKESEDLI